VRARGLAVALACAGARARIALLIQHAKRMRCITLSFVASLVPPYFSTFSHTLNDFRGERKKKIIEHKMRVSIFSAILI
jgi:hypothetical protein